MSTSEGIDLTFFIDTDNSPFVLFDHRGAIRYLNDAAEILLAYTDKHELHKLALSYAPRDFGSRTTPIELNYHQLSFYAITVAYADEEHIGLRLYYRSRPKTLQPLDAKRMTYTNINILLEAAVTLFDLGHATPFDLLTDTDLPEFKLDQNGFSRLLRKCLHLFRSAHNLHIRLTLPIGEAIFIENTSWPVVRLAFNADSREEDQDSTIGTLAETMHIVLSYSPGQIMMDIPFIRSD
jgi:hypothetical protein